MKKIVLLLLLLIFLAPGLASAELGVGIGSGKIEVREDLKPGMIYQLPGLSVFNTGDEEANYQMRVSYHNKQPELVPDKEWFSFSPQEFQLKPGEAKIVKIKLSLPTKVIPGDYFAYLESRPMKTVEKGGANIGIAAASKLYFTVVPANLVLGVYYRIASLWELYWPWSGRIAGLLTGLVLILIARRYLKFQVSFTKKEPKEPKEPKKQDG